MREFGPDHLGALAIIALLCAGAALGGRRLPERAQEAGRWGLAALLLGYALAYYAVALSQRGFRWDESLPINVCDVVLYGAVAALLLRSRVGFELAYFWGLAGTLQGLLTPDLRSGFPTFRYFHFFWGHGTIILAVVWLLAVERCVPRPGSVLRMFAVLNGYALVVGLLDWTFGWNYAYLHHRPGHHSLLDFLGPFPWYILSGEAIALGSFWILHLPWRHRHREAVSVR